MTLLSRRGSVTAGIMVGMFLAALEATVVGTAMPTVVATLGGFDIYSWVFSAYLLTSTVTVPAWGRLSDVYGRRRLYLLALSFFIGGSVLSGMSGSMAELIIARAIQGMGAGGLLPIGLTIIGELYTPVERVRLQGYFSSVWAFASIAGPLAGGFLTDQLDWRWVFYINIPFGAAAALIIATQFREEPARFDGRRLDVTGLSLFSLSMTLLMLLLVRNEGAIEVGSPMTLALVAAVVVTFVLFIRIERAAESPLLPRELFSNRVFLGATLNGFLGGMSMFGLLSFVPLFVQGVQGTDATSAGSVLTPLLLSWVVFSTIGGRLLLRFTFRQVMFAGMLLMLAGFVLMDLVTVQTSRTTIFWNVGILGAGMGLATITAMVAVQDSVPREILGIATSTSQFFRSIGGALGVAVMGSVMSYQMRLQAGALSERLGPGAAERLRQVTGHPDAFLQPAVRSGLPADLTAHFQSILAAALHSVFLTGTLFCVVALISVFLMPPVRLKRDAANTSGGEVPA